MNDSRTLRRQRYEHARAEIVRLMSQTSGTEQPDVPLSMFESALREMVKEEECGQPVDKP